LTFCDSSDVTGAQYLHAGGGVERSVFAICCHS